MPRATAVVARHLLSRAGPAVSAGTAPPLAAERSAPHRLAFFAPHRGLWLSGGTRCRATAARWVAAVDRCKLLTMSGATCAARARRWRCWRPSAREPASPA
eukprot:COSAG06_NODE_167_length_21546_cov_35.001352_7_plen_101_part_00